VEQKRPLWTDTNSSEDNIKPGFKKLVERLSGWGKLCDSHNFPHPVHIACCSTPNSRPPATKTLHTIYGNNTSIVSSSWWCAYECPKHVEQIISAIKHSVASSWFSSLRLYYDARTNMQQIYEHYCLMERCTLQSYTEDWNTRFFHKGENLYQITRHETHKGSKINSCCIKPSPPVSFGPIDQRCVWLLLTYCHSFSTEVCVSYTCYTVTLQYHPLCTCLTIIRN
jgi:hypothetical protein